MSVFSDRSHSSPTSSPNTDPSPAGRCSTKPSTPTERLNTATPSRSRWPCCRRSTITSRLHHLDLTPGSVPLLPELSRTGRDSHHRAPTRPGALHRNALTEITTPVLANRPRLTPLSPHETLRASTWFRTPTAQSPVRLRRMRHTYVHVTAVPMTLNSTQNSAADPTLRP